MNKFRKLVYKKKDAGSTSAPVRTTSEPTLPPDPPRGPSANPRDIEDESTDIMETTIPRNLAPDQDHDEPIESAARPDNEAEGQGANPSPANEPANTTSNSFITRHRISRREKKAEKLARDARGLLLLNEPLSAPPSNANSEEVVGIAADIVAIHGLNGHRLDTWTAKDPLTKEEYLWLKDGLVKKFPMARVFTFGYSAGLVGNISRLQTRDIAVSLLVELATKRQPDKDKERPILFVAHSLGGIVVKQALLIANQNSSPYMEIAERTKGVVFFGTPHFGADIAKYGAMLSKIAKAAFLNPSDAFLKTLRQDSPQIDSVNGDFRSIARKYHFTSFYEGDVLSVPILGPAIGRIVDKMSAIMNYPDIEEPIPINGNHILMCKFLEGDDRLETVFLQMRRILEAERADIVRELSRATRDEIVTLQKGIDDIRFTLSQRQSEQELQKIERERQAVLDWLSPLNFYHTHLEWFRRREEGTGSWLFESDLFKDWFGRKIQTLWLPGMPGGGKTILASAIINFLEEALETNAAVAYIYCNYQENKHTAVNFVASILQQLIRKRGTLSADIQKLYNRDSKERIRPSLAQYSELLELHVRYFSAVYIVIDALDECSEDEGVKIFLREIRKIQSITPHTQLLITSRSVPYLKSEIEKSHQIAIAAADEDIKTYVTARIQNNSQLTRHVQTDPTLQTAIITSVIKKAHGMFLLVRYHLDSLERADTRRDLRKALSNLPEKLDQIYKFLLNRLLDQDRQKVKRAKQVLSWIYFAIRPLTVIELQHALAIEPDDIALDDEALPDMTSVISSCAGLVDIDQERNVIRLAHYSAKEYLDKAHLELFPTAKVEITQACLAYLSLDIFADGCCGSDIETEMRLQEYPFLEYAASHWGYHAQGGPEEHHTIQKLIGDFLGQELKVASSVQIQYIPSYRFQGYSQLYPRSVSALHLAAAFGLKETVRILIAAGNDLAARDSTGMTCLHSGASNGQQEVVELLLESGAEIEAKDNTGMRALHWAASRGHSAVIQILLQRVVEVEARTDLDETALYHAASKGHAISTRLLLEKGANPNSSEQKYSWTPILKAAYNGHVAVVRLLLEYGADASHKETEYEQSALCLACEGGSDDVVRLLLSTDAIDVNDRDKLGRTPLLNAARLGREKAIRALLERTDVDRNVMDDQKMTPLFHAGERGFDVISDLLEATASNPFENRPSPIIQSVSDRDAAAVRDLLEQGVVDPNTRSTRGYTPLILAAKNGDDKIVQLLLANNRVDREAKCPFGRTPLSWAAGNGYVSVVQLLLRKGVDVNSRATSKRTPLVWAALMGQAAVVEVLVQEDGIELDAQGGPFDATALYLAAEWGNERMVTALLERGASPHIPMGRGDTYTPQWVAEYLGHEKIVQLIKAKIKGT